MEKFHKKFLRMQFICSGISNAVLNALAFYLGNRAMKPLAWPDVAVDAFITCGFVSLLVTLPTAYFTGKAIKAGLPLLPPVKWLNRLPRKKWKLWLFLWFFSALIVVTILAAVYELGNITSIAFGTMLIARFAWCGLLGGVFGILVGARYLQPETIAR